MKPPGKRRTGSLWRALLAGIFVAGAVAQASGQEFPSKPVTLVVPYAPGGGAELFGRALQNKMSEVLKQPVLIETKPGASTTIGAAAVARATSDGYTLLLTVIPAHAVAAWTVANLPYHALDSFAPIGQVAMGMPNFLIVRMSSNFHSVRDLVAAARSKPGTITYATAGAGSSVHLVGELLSSVAGIQLVHVPHRGAGPATLAVLGGHVDFAVVDGGTVTGQQALRLLGATSAKRWPMYPDVPTLVEQGFPVEMDSAVVLMAPAKTPQTIVEKLNAALRETVSSPEIHKRLSEMGYEVDVTSPDELTRRIAGELDQFGKLVKQIGGTSQ